MPITPKAPAQTFLGLVVGTAMQKTIKVRVARPRIHPLVQKPVIYHKNFLAHDEETKCVVGDWVRIDSCPKVSKRKNFTLGEIVRPAARYTDANGKLHTQAQRIPEPLIRRAGPEERH
ncbi:37S ribosomal protein S17 mitochondrial [Dinochytrium kinnereticum]|nr:37S ribosomal protein S17 mitochondrial [Dinochytrium kinnereticum]